MATERRRAAGSEGPIRVLLAEDHQILQQGVAAILATCAGVDVVGHALDGHVAVQMARDLSPDVVVMDIGLPLLNGIEATRQIRDLSAKIEVVALTMHDDKRYVHAMFAVGAKAYVLKNSATDELIQAIKSASRGRRFLSQGVTDVVMHDYLSGGQPAAPLSAALAPREREIVQLLAEGKSSGEIASLLDLATSTVATHRRNIMRKLGIHTVAGLTKYAVREGLTML